MRRTVGSRAASGRTEIIAMRQMDELTTRGLAGITSEEPA